MKKSQNYVGGAVILAVFALITKVVGAFYRIPLTNLLGAEGMGMYQLVFSIYALVIAITSGSVPIAVSRLVAEKNAVGADSRGTFRAAFWAVLAFAVVVSAALIFLGKYVAVAQGNGAIDFCYTIITPAIIFVSVLSLFRGWFQGNFNVIPTAVSQLIEQILKLIFGLLFAKLLSSRGVLYAVYGALLGVTVSEFAALIYMFLRYVFGSKNKLRTSLNGAKNSNFKEFTKTVVPIAIVGFILPFSQFIDSILIVNLLKVSGESTALATADYGLFSGTVLSVVNMPVVITLSLSVALVPAVSANRIDRNIDGIIKKSATAVKLSYVIGLPAALLMFVYARPIVLILYPRLSSAEIMIAVNLLRITCFSVVFQAQMQIYGSLLTALDRVKDSAKNTVAAVLAKTAVSVALLLTIGISGAAYASLVLGVSATLLNVLTFNNLLGKNVKLVKNVSTILICSVIMMSVALPIYFAVSSSVVSLVLGGVISVAVYALCLMLFRVFDAGELDGIPLSRFFEKLTLKIRFWEKEK